MYGDVQPRNHGILPSSKHHMYHIISIYISIYLHIYPSVCLSHIRMSTYTHTSQIFSHLLNILESEATVRTTAAFLHTHKTLKPSAPLTLPSNDSTHYERDITSFIKHSAASKSVSIADMDLRLEFKMTGWDFRINPVLTTYGLMDR